MNFPSVFGGLFLRRVCAHICATARAGVANPLIAHTAAILPAPLLSEAVMAVSMSKRKRRSAPVDLARFAAELRALVAREDRQRRLSGHFPFSIDPRAALAVADAIDARLAGKHKSLDRALGLVRRGPPRRPGKHVQLAIDAAWRQWNGHSWKKICDDLGYKDVRNLQHICDENHDAVVEHYAGLLSGK
jgi:hypothetical protein